VKGLGSERAQVAGDMRVYQGPSKQDPYLTTFVAPAVIGSSTSSNQKTCLPGSTFRIGDHPEMILWQPKFDAGRGLSLDRTLIGGDEHSQR